MRLPLLIILLVSLVVADSLSSAASDMKTQLNSKIATYEYFGDRYSYVLSTTVPNQNVTFTPYKSSSKNSDIIDILVKGPSDSDFTVHSMGSVHKTLFKSNKDDAIVELTNLEEGTSLVIAVRRDGKTDGDYDARTDDSSNFGRFFCIKHATYDGLVMCGYNRDTATSTTIHVKNILFTVTSADDGASELAGDLPMMKLHYPADSECTPVQSNVTYLDLEDDFLSRVKTALPTGVKVNSAFYDVTLDPNLHILTSTQVSVTFLFEGAGYHNVFGYFTYDGSKEILTEETIFPDASQGSSCLQSGITVDIGTFDAGTNIGFWLRSNGNNYPFSHTFYSIDDYNSDGRKHTAIFTDAPTGRTIVGMEDLYDKYDDSNDCVFYVTTSAATDQGQTPQVGDDGEVVDSDLIDQTVNAGEGSEYASGDNSSPDRVDDTNSNDVNIEDLEDDGWSIADPTNDTMDIIVTKPWGAECIILSDGNSYFSENGSLCVSNVTDPTTRPVVEVPPVSDTNHTHKIIVVRNSTNSTDYETGNTTDPETGLPTDSTYPVSSNHCWQKTISYYYEFWGQRYASIDNMPVFETERSGLDGCQSDAYEVPDGYELAPNDDYTRLYLTKIAPLYATGCVVLADGTAYTVGGGSEISGSYLSSTHFSRHLHKPSTCNCRVLVRSTDSVVEPNVTDPISDDDCYDYENTTVTLFPPVSVIGGSPDSCVLEPLQIPDGWQLVTRRSQIEEFLAETTLDLCVGFADGEFYQLTLKEKVMGAALELVFDHCDGLEILNISGWLMPSSCGAVLILEEIPEEPEEVYVPPAIPTFNDTEVWGGVYGLGHIKTFDQASIEAPAGTYLALDWDYGNVTVEIHECLGVTGFTGVIEHLHRNATFSVALSNDSIVPEIVLNGTVITNGSVELPGELPVSIQVNGTVQRLVFDQQAEATDHQEDYVITIDTKLGPILKFVVWSVDHEDWIHDVTYAGERFVSGLFIGLPPELQPLNYNETTVNYTSGLLGRWDHFTTDDYDVDVSDYLVSATDIVMSESVCDNWAYNHKDKPLALSTSVLADWAASLLKSDDFGSYGLSFDDYLCDSFALSDSLQSQCVKELELCDPILAMVPLYGSSFLAELSSAVLCSLDDVAAIPDDSWELLYANVNNTLVMAGRTYMFADGFSPLYLRTRLLDALEITQVPLGYQFAPQNAESRALNYLSPLVTGEDPHIVRSGPHGKCFATYGEAPALLMKEADVPISQPDNPSFESGLDSWTCVEDTNTTISTVSPGRSGENALQVDVTITSGLPQIDHQGLKSYVEQELTVNSQGPFAVEAWGRALDGIKEKKYFNYYQPGLSLVVLVSYEDGTNETFFGNYHLRHDEIWEKVVVNVVPRSTISSVTVRFHVEALMGTVQFDDIRVVAASSNILLNGGFDSTVLGEWFPLTYNVTVDDWTEEVTEWMRDEHRYAIFWEGYGNCAYNTTNSTTVRPIALEGRSYSLKMWRGTEDDGDTPCTGDRGAYQQLILNQSDSVGSQVVYLGGFVKADGVNGTADSKWSFWIDLEFMDNTTLLAQVEALPTGTYDWKWRQLVFEVTKPIQVAHVYVRFASHNGTVHVDDMALLLIPSEGGRGSTRGAFGDPHIVTMDDEIYNHQLPGDFVFASHSEFVVHSRFQAIGQGTATTGVAMRALYDRVEVYPGASGDVPIVYVNGTSRSFSKRLVLDEAETTLTLANIDGQHALLFEHSSFIATIGLRSGTDTQFFTLQVGVPDGEEFDSGLVVSVCTGTDHLLTDASDSLFTYSNGESPSTYYDPLFTPATLDDFTEEEQASARATCLAVGAGIGDDADSLLEESFIEACMFDILATGDTSFSHMIFETQGTFGFTTASYSTQTESSTTDPDDDDLPVFVIVAMALGVAVVVALLAFFVSSKKNNRSEHYMGEMVPTRAFVAPE